MIVSASGLACVRGGRRLYAGLSFTVAAGESLRVIGPNGVGKSSLIRQICGLLPCNEGTLDAGGAIALADERSALDSEKTLIRALAFWAEMDGISDARLRAALDLLALTPLADLPVRMLSTGQRKRAALARVFASDAPLWLLDEPGNGLDGAALSALGVAMDAHVAGGGAIIAASHFDLPHSFAHSINLADFAP